MSAAPRQSRLELDAALRCPLSRPEAEALVALLTGRRPVAPPRMRCSTTLRRPWC